ncbi:MAG: hypothetical protein IJ087_14905 [Eggerthellaceae bacterium]|nr:hypothetical protein [Eggerthellaceae bacterium]
MRLLSDAALSDALPWHLEDGHAYHIATNGEVDGTSIITHVLRAQHVYYALFATWCVGKLDAKVLREMCDKKLIDRLDLYTGEVFKESRHAGFEQLANVARVGHGRLVRFKNHAKVACIYGDRYDVCIETSANLNVNPRCENATVTVSTELCDFWKEFYDEIPSNNDEFGRWTPWTRESQTA